MTEDSILRKSKDEGGTTLVLKLDEPLQQFSIHVRIRILYCAFLDPLKHKLFNLII